MYQICQNCQKYVYCCVSKKCGRSSRKSREVSKGNIEKRDRAPSRVFLKKIHSLFHKKVVVRSNIKNYIKHNVPVSSRMKLFCYASMRVEILNRMEYVCFSYLKYKKKVFKFGTLIFPTATAMARHFLK